jgi:hypothetical protein
MSDTDVESLIQKKYAVQSGKQELERFFNDPKWSKSRLYRVASSFLLKADCETAFDLIDRQWDCAGGDHLNSDADVHERVQALNAPAFRMAFERLIYLGNVGFIQSLDTTTRVMNGTIYDEDPRQPLDFVDLSPRFFLRPFAPGTFHEVIGPVTIESIKRGEKGKKALGVGKTNSEGLMMEMLAKDGWDVISNYEIKNMPPGISMCYDLKQVFIRCIQNFKAGKKTMFVIDEIAQCVPKVRATSDSSLILGQIAFLLRKVGAAMTVISQRQNDIPTVIDSMCESTIMKKSQKVMTFQYANKDYLIKNVPPTSLEYNTHFISPFVIKFDIEGMHQAIAEVAGDPNADQFQIMLDFLNADQMEITVQDLKRYAKVAYISGAKQRAIAATISTFGRRYSQQTVSNWLAEMGVTTNDDD